MVHVARRGRRATTALTTDRQFTTQVAGLFLFVPQLLALDLPDAVRRAGLPGSEAIPPLHAFLALLLPKLLGHRRISHISDLCADEGRDSGRDSTSCPRRPTPPTIPTAPTAPCTNASSRP